MEILAFLAFLIVVYWLVSQLEQGVSKRRQLEERVADLEVQGDPAADWDEDLDQEVGDNLSTEDQALLRRFCRKPEFTIEDVSQLSEGQIVRLVARSYFYPSSEPFVESFEYRHGRISPTSSEWGYEVFGFRRENAIDDWKEFSFMAGEEESSTWSCAGTIRRL